MITRDRWIGVLQEAAYEQEALQVVESDVDSYGCAGVRVDVVESRCRYQGEVIAGRFRVTQTRVTPDGKPQLMAVQYTSAPAE